jgi:lysozyme
MPYTDSVGKTTIGVGRNLTDNGITQDEAFTLLDNDIDQALEDAKSLVSNFNDLGDVRQRVLVDMSFNLGRARLKGFKKMLAAIESGMFTTATREMLDSKWARQVGSRATRLSSMMKSGLD